PRRAGQLPEGATATTRRPAAARDPRLLRARARGRESALRGALCARRDHGARDHHRRLLPPLDDAALPHAHARAADTADGGQLCAVRGRAGSGHRELESPGEPLALARDGGRAAPGGDPLTERRPLGTPHDCLRVEGLELECIVGIRPAERKRPQRVRLDVTLGLDLTRAGRSGRIAHTVDYSLVLEEVTNL